MLFPIAMALNTDLLKAARGEPVSRTPVWLFRQAGRHMPEYRALKERTGLNFLELLKNPNHVAEVTLQPLKRYDVDAAILFSDILVLPQICGIDVYWDNGIRVTPLSDVKEVAARAADAPLDRLRHVEQAIHEIRSRIDLPLLGFSAAPFTLLYYSWGGTSKKKIEITDTSLMEVYETLILEYLDMQVNAGVHAIQIFEAMAMALSEAQFKEIALPHLLSLGRKFKAKHPQIPLFVFARGAKNLLDVNTQLATVYDVITLDTEASRRDHRQVIEKCLQGNFDPKYLVDTPVDDIDKLVDTMITDFGRPLIANIGEGLAGNEDPVLVEHFVNSIHRR